MTSVNFRMAIMDAAKRMFHEVDEDVMHPMFTLHGAGGSAPISYCRWEYDRSQPKEIGFTPLQAIQALESETIHREDMTFEETNDELQILLEEAFGGGKYRAKPYATHLVEAMRRIYNRFYHWLRNVREEGESIEKMALQTSQIMNLLLDVGGYRIPTEYIDEALSILREEISHPGSLARVVGAREADFWREDLHLDHPGMAKLILEGNPLNETEKSFLRAITSFDASVYATVWIPTEGEAKPISRLAWFIAQRFFTLNDPLHELVDREAAFMSLSRFTASEDRMVEGLPGFISRFGGYYYGGSSAKNWPKRIFPNYYIPDDRFACSTLWFLIWVFEKQNSSVAFSPPIEKSFSMQTFRRDDFPKKEKAPHRREEKPEVGKNYYLNLLLVQPRLRNFHILQPILFSEDEFDRKVLKRLLYLAGEHKDQLAEIDDDYDRGEPIQTINFLGAWAPSNLLRYTAGNLRAFTIFVEFFYVNRDDYDWIDRLETYPTEALKILATHPAFHYKTILLEQVAKILASREASSTHEASST